MNYIKVIYDYADTFLNFIYPRNIYCILCNIPIDRDEKYSICHDCKSKLEFIRGRVCKQCGRTLNPLYIMDRCDECLDNSYFYKRAISCLEYDDLSKKIIFDLKYHKKRYISYHIAEIIYDRLKESDIYFDIIIPIPLYGDKERERSFNQASIIGKYIGRMGEVDVDDKTLIRARNTISQNKLTKEERRENLDGAFDVINRNNIINKNILLIDDIFTTGATINECSRILLENRARNVYAATFATGRNSY